MFTQGLVRDSTELNSSFSFSFSSCLVILFLTYCVTSVIHHELYVDHIRYLASGAPGPGLNCLNNKLNAELKPTCIQNCENSYSRLGLVKSYMETRTVTCPLCYISWGNVFCRQAPLSSFPYNMHCTDVWFNINKQCHYSTLPGDVGKTCVASYTHRTYPSEKLFIELRLSLSGTTMVH